MDKVSIIECPRDAMQGLRDFIPTKKKVDYLNQLLKVGFHTIDFGSFVSPKAIPQMRDTAEVLHGLDSELLKKNKLLAIVANLRGAKAACEHPEIDYLGYPFSISETFQLRNTNATIDESLDRLSDILEIAKDSNKEMVVYLSMGFGNPYGDPWNAEIVIKWSEILYSLGVRILMLSDTIGVARPESISYIFSQVIPILPEVIFGAHFHTAPHNWEEKIEAAYSSGCRRFDGAIKGYGGCPMAKDELTGNMPTENVLSFFNDRRIETGIDELEFRSAILHSSKVFPLD
ncbi:MAG: hydroxymethylglutaryl-CoA lyase [Chitinophagaceae bacterium]|nr:MAG: hydroxymethylglutaryl-CoA lyase [Chitinophagaceae bacterium]